MLVFLGMPHRGTIHAGAARAFFAASGSTPVIPVDFGTSVLTKGFNTLWASALSARSQGVTHFGMLHSDVVPADGWLDVLADDLKQTNADVVSAVVPIRSHHGLTSTALGDARHIWQPVRRLTMQECYGKLPHVFTRRDVEWEDISGPPDLFINTGCWLAKLGEWSEKIVFRNVERMLRRGDQWLADTLSEDWAFSCDLARLGCKVVVTQRVTLYHDQPQYVNSKPWGTQAVDEYYFEQTKWTKKPSPCVGPSGD